MTRGIEAAFWATAGRDAESRQSKAGNTFVTINAAVDNGTDQDGKTQSTWVKVLCFGQIAEAAARIEKGQRLYCEGSLQVGTWQTNDRQTRLDVTLKAWKCDRVGQIGKNRPKRQNGEATASGRQSYSDDAPAELNDEIPF